MRCIVVGAGGMGRWFAAVTGGWLDPVFVDIDQPTARRVAQAFDAQSRGPQELESAPIVCTAVPLSETPAALETYVQYADRAVIDLSGAMSEPLEIMRKHGDNLERINLHALFAPEHSPGRVAAVVENTASTWPTLREHLEGDGNEVFETTAETHDRAMETVQASAHTAVLAYALASERVPPEFHTPISADLESLATRVLSGPPVVYRDIQTTFAGAERVAEAASRLAGADPQRFERLYEQAAESNKTDE